MKTIDVKQAVQQLQNAKPIIIIDQEKGFSEATIATSGHFFTQDQFKYIKRLNEHNAIRFVSNYKSVDMIKTDPQIAIVLDRFISVSNSSLNESLSYAYPMGVLRRSGHEEAIIDLNKIAALSPCGLLLSLSNMDEVTLIDFATNNKLPIITISSII